MSSFIEISPIKERDSQIKFLFLLFIYLNMDLSNKGHHQQSQFKFR